MSKQEVLQKIEKLRTELFNLATDPKQTVDVRNRGYWISIGAAGAISIVEELDEPPITDEQAWNKIAEAYPDSPQSLRNTLDNAVFGKASKSQKPVVPQFVSEWFEDNKDILDLAIFMAIRKLDDEEWPHKTDFENWLDVVENKPIETLIRMKDGYEIEKEPMYYIKLPGGKNYDMFVDGRDGNLKVFLNGAPGTQYTEQQIKAIDERYWVFAVPVEEG